MLTIESLRRLMLALAVALVMSQVAEASEEMMPNGATTLSRGVSAIGFDMGLDAPQPLVLGFRVDHGVTDRLQLGASFSYFVMALTATGHGKFGLLRSEDGLHRMALELDVGYLRTFHIFGDLGDVLNSVVLRPAIGYELRPWTSRRTGFFLKVGSLHLYADREVDWTEQLGDREDEHWAHVARFTTGVQHRFGKGFSANFDISMHVPRQTFLGKMGFTWSF